MLLSFCSTCLKGAIISVSDSLVLEGLSPYNWVCKDGSISSAVNGAYLIVNFKGTRKVALQVDNKHMKFLSPDRFPIICWKVNDGKIHTHQLVAGEESVLLSSDVTDPVINIYINGMSPFESRFSGDLPSNAVKISGFVVDEGASVIKVKRSGKVWLTIGDSILSGDGASLKEGQGRPPNDLWASSDDARACYSYLLAQHYGYLESRIAYGGYNWGGGMANMPALSLLIDNVTSTVGRLKNGKLSPVPDIVFINLGENGTPEENDVLQALEKLRSRVSRLTKIIVTIPVSGRARNKLTRSFIKYKAAAADDQAYLIDLGRITFATADGQHPTAIGHKAIYKALLPEVDAIMRGVNNSPEMIPVWKKPMPDREGRLPAKNAYITVFRPVKPNGAAVIICPGGGYGGLVTGPEGYGIAKWLNKQGITGVVLEYRLPEGDADIPLLDAQKAIRMVRSNAQVWEIDSERIGIMGFSAGGHLASTAATHFDNGNIHSRDPIGKIGSRPDFAVLIYPVISMGNKTHMGSKNNLLGPNPTEETVNKFSNEKQVTLNTPPVFLAHAQDDSTVSPDNSKMFYDALLYHKVSAFYLVLPSGGHGLNGYKGPMWDAWQTQLQKWFVAQKIIPSLNE